MWSRSHEYVLPTCQIIANAWKWDKLQSKLVLYTQCKHPNLLHSTQKLELYPLLTSSRPKYMHLDEPTKIMPKHKQKMCSLKNFGRTSVHKNLDNRVCTFNSFPSFNSRSRICLKLWWNICRVYCLAVAFWMLR